ncbi:MAG: hypothetical protein AAGI51_04845 [Pseudomonadota bacterium]
MKIARIAVAALGLAAFSAAPAFAAGCSYSYSTTTEQTQSTPAAGA